MDDIQVIREALLLTVSNIGKALAALDRIEKEGKWNLQDHGK